MSLIYGENRFLKLAFLHECVLPLFLTAAPQMIVSLQAVLMYDRADFLVRETFYPTLLQ